MPLGVYGFAVTCLHASLASASQSALQVPAPCQLCTAFLLPVILHCPGMAAAVQHSDRPLHQPAQVCHLMSRSVCLTPCTHGASLLHYAMAIDTHRCLSSQSVPKAFA